MIQMNRFFAKIYQLWCKNMILDPGLPLSLSLYEIKVRINTRYAVSISCSANVAPK